MSSFGTFSAARLRDLAPVEEQVITVCPAAIAGLTGVSLWTGKRIPLHVFDRACDIKAINIRASAAGTAHSIQFKLVPSGTAASTSSATTAITATSDGVVDADDLTANTVKTVALNSNADNVAAGTTLYMICEAGLDDLALDTLVTIRLTSLREMATDASGVVRQVRHVNDQYADRI